MIKTDVGEYMYRDVNEERVAELLSEKRTRGVTIKKTTEEEYNEMFLKGE